MAKMKRKICFQCGVSVEKEMVALNMKLISRNIERFMCKQCLAEFNSCTEDELDVLIEYFTEEGCTLFR